MRTREPVIGKRKRRSKRIAYWTWRAKAKPSRSSSTAAANAVRSQRSSSSEYIQYGLRWRIMNGSKGRSPRMWVRSWTRSQSMYADSESSARREQAGGVRGQVEAQDLGRGAADAAEALGLAVAEDRAEVVVGRALGGRERLREEDGALGVVAGGAVDEGDREELRVVEAGALELVDPLRPGDADDQRLEAGVAWRRSACTSGRRRGARSRRGGRARGGRPRASGRRRASGSRRRPRRACRRRARRCRRPDGGSGASAPAPTRRSRARGCGAWPGRGRRCRSSRRATG